MIERPALPPTTWAPARTGLLVFDLLEHYRAGIEAAGVHVSAPPLMAACRAKGVPVFYARADHRADGMDFALTVADTDNKHVPVEHGAPGVMEASARRG